MLKYHTYSIHPFVLHKLTHQTLILALLFHAKRYQKTHLLLVNPSATTLTPFVIIYIETQTPSFFSSKKSSQ